MVNGKVSQNRLNIRYKIKHKKMPYYLVQFLLRQSDTYIHASIIRVCRTAAEKKEALFMRDYLNSTIDMPIGMKARYIVTKTRLVHYHTLISFTTGNVLYRGLQCSNIYNDVGYYITEFMYAGITSWRNLYARWNAIPNVVMTGCPIFSSEISRELF